MTAFDAVRTKSSPEIPDERLHAGQPSWVLMVLVNHWVPGSKPEAEESRSRIRQADR